MQMTEFFDSYARALMDRDEARVATMYAVPSLILFPGQSIAVSDATQTQDFFASSWDQYEGVTQASPDITIVAETSHSVWADVTWRHDDEPKERFVYQLVRDGDGWQIAVLTPVG